MDNLPVFYTPKMVAPSDSFSPSAAKPAHVVASWQRLGIPLRIIEPTQATVAEFALAHDEQHVRDILACRKNNGFGNRSADVATSLPYTTGSMLSAARHVLRHGGAAAAPCSGFHHAGFSSVEGFCTFNGLMVTACVLRHEGLVRRVGIIDCDMHFGNGTAEIVKRLDAHHWLRHFTAGDGYSHASQADDFLATLPYIVGRFDDCDIALYQAGADPHVRDPLGGWLTTEQLRQRDALVFEGLRQIDVPVVWNLAGGYQVELDGTIPKVLEIHDNTALECWREFSSAATCNDRQRA